MATESDEELTLSSSTMDALRAFYAERDDHARRFADLKAAAETDADERVAASGEAPLSMDTFTEDWNKSQFWYSDETARLLAQQLLDGANETHTVVVLSAPSVFVMLRNLANARPASQRPRLILLEHDDRFTVFGDDYIFYDFNEPLKLPGTLRGCADRIICDPPFLSQDCQTKGKASLTARWLSKPSTRVVVCTGERMADLVTDKLYRGQGVRTTTFEPQHARGLSNEFYCYANFECAGWSWR